MLVSAADVAAYTGLHRVTIWRLARAGRLPFVRVGNSYRFDPIEVAAAVTATQKDGSR